MFVWIVWCGVNSEAYWFGSNTRACDNGIWWVSYTPGPILQCVQCWSITSTTCYLYYNENGGAIYLFFLGHTIITFISVYSYLFLKFGYFCCFVLLFSTSFSFTYHGHGIKDCDCCWFYYFSLSWHKLYCSHHYKKGATLSLDQRAVFSERYTWMVTESKSNYIKKIEWHFVTSLKHPQSERTLLVMSMHGWLVCFFQNYLNVN